MKIIYWNTDTDVMVMPEGLLDLQKIAALDHRIKVFHGVNGMDIVSCSYYGTCSAVLYDIDYDPKATDSRVVQCWHERDRSKIPSIPLKPIHIEEGYTLPSEVEKLFRAYC